jgi:hypothetical protein
MGLILGGPEAWKIRKQGDIVIAYQWVNGEPAMLMWPERKPLGCVPYCIGMSHAYKYAKNTGYPTEYCIQQAIVAAQVMGMDSGRETVKHIVEIILDGLEDLVKMPEERPKKDNSPPLGTATLFQGGTKIVDGEITTGPEKELFH